MQTITSDLPFFLFLFGKLYAMFTHLETTRFHNDTLSVIRLWFYPNHFMIRKITSETTNQVFFSLSLNFYSSTAFIVSH